MPRVNSCTDPWPSSGAWKSYGGSVVDLAAFPRGKAWSAGAFTGPYTNFAGAPPIAAAPGQVWSAVLSVQVSRAQDVLFSFACYREQDVASNNATATSDAVTIAVPATTPTLLRIAGITLPAGTYTLAGANVDLPAAKSGDTLLAGACRQEQVNDATIVFLDGNSAGWAWDGPVGASSSREVPTGPEPGRFLIAV